jgi:hypothetical protein
MIEGESSVIPKNPVIEFHFLIICYDGSVINLVLYVPKFDESFTMAHQNAL